MIRRAAPHPKPVPIPDPMPPMPDPQPDPTPFPGPKPTRRQLSRGGEDVAWTSSPPVLAAFLHTPSVLPDISPSRVEIGSFAAITRSETPEIGESRRDSQSPPLRGDVRQDRGGWLEMPAPPLPATAQRVAAGRLREDITVVQSDASYVVPVPGGLSR